MKLAVVLVAVATSAHADPDSHGSIAAGGSLLFTAEGGGSRLRVDGEIDLTYGRYGGLVALRAYDSSHDGLVFAGFVYEAAASRPRLVLDFHADLGADLDVHAPALGGGLRTTIAIYGPIGVALDIGGYLVIDGVDNTRFVIDGSTMLALRW